MKLTESIIKDNNVLNTFVEKKTESQQIKVNHSNRFVKIPVEKIIRLEADCNYTTVYTQTQKFTSAKTIGLYEELLDNDVFLRVHKKHIVNIGHIVSLEVQKTNAEIKMYGGKNVEVSRRKLKNVVKKIETYRY